MNLQPPETASKDIIVWLRYFFSNELCKENVSLAGKNSGGAERQQENGSSWIFCFHLFEYSEKFDQPITRDAMFFWSPQTSLIYCTNQQRIASVLCHEATSLTI